MLPSSLRPRIVTLVLALWLCACALITAVDRSKFRTCDQTQFCKKYRFHAPTDDIAVVPSSIAIDNAAQTLRFDLQVPGSETLLQGKLQFVLEDTSSAVPAVRLHVTEKWTDPADPRARWENPDVLQRDAKATRAFTRTTPQESGLTDIPTNVQLFKPVSAAADITIAMRLAPFGVDVYLNREKVISTNADRQFHYEIRRQRAVSTESSETKPEEQTVDVHEGKTIVDYGEDGLAIYSDGTVQKKAEPVAAEPVVTSTSPSDEGWEESFGGHTDKKKFGPSSIGLDIAFYGQRGLYGIPEHATDFLLKDTVQVDGSVVSDPYRLYNLDVFEYELDVPMTLYGSIPVLVAPNAQSTVGVFWHNPSETFVDIATDQTTKTKKTHWLSESGVLDLFFLIGPTSADFFGQYTLLTGRAQLPPLFAIGYHQCRWNYKNEADVDRVDAGFDEHLIPYDVLWLDIEHTRGKRYYTWDEHAFPTPVAMQERVARTGRKMVTIVDPHIKVDADYYVHKDATAKRMYVRDEEGKDFHGWCWPGDSSYVDFTCPEARQWWSALFRYETYEGSTKHLFTWNDMNEPSVFNGPEVSMRKTCLNRAGVEHREWHNLYGYYMHQATMEGQLVRQLPPGQSEITLTSSLQRPFVLSRAFFAGTQRFGAIWTGDNKAEWGHFQYSTKMLLSMSVAGLTFVGADVGGFFGNPDTELLTRWYQAAAFQPFFRGHAHHDSNRREPWVFGEPHTSRIRSAIRWRYALLPYVYTLFHDCAAIGLPVMRPLWMHHAQHERSFAEEDQFLLGEDLLVKPITAPGITETSVFLPEGVWYHIFDDYKRFVSKGEVMDQIPAPIEFSPVFQRGGSVIARKNRVRRSSALMRDDPLTLVVAMGSDSRAHGSLYLDDGESFAFATRDMAYTQVQFDVKRDAMRATVAHRQYSSRAWIERIEIHGFGGKAPSKVMLNRDTALEATYDVNKDVLVIRKPGVLASNPWMIQWE